MNNNLFGKEKHLTRSEKMQITRKQTNEFQSWVIDWLNNSGQFKAWRVNNIPSTRLANEKKQLEAETLTGEPITVIATIPVVYHKKNQKQFSIFDVCGFRLSDGKHLEIEIKTKNDTLDKDQKEHMSDLQTTGCISFATGDKHSFLLQIMPYMAEKQLAF